MELELKVRAGRSNEGDEICPAYAIGPITFSKEVGMIAWEGDTDRNGLDASRVIVIVRLCVQEVTRLEGGF